ncbi:MAG TPA: hypothetical protein EYO33_24055 [Phycisphaerales bacterium]|nr:hypothetical protein [Phycisphaerales bacterium]
MAVEWEYIPAFSIDKEVVRQDALPEDETNYMEPEYSDLKPATEIVRFSAVGMTPAEFESLSAQARQRNLVLSITDNNGDVWVGKFRSLSGRVIGGTSRRGDIELAIQVY